jgi:very-short-patch-repair endonuclease
MASTGIARARVLRRESTKQERRLWFLVRAGRLDGFRFRRQEVIGPFIVDFICFKGRLIVELDGSQHFTDRSYDEARDSYLKGLGFTVLRFWNNELWENEVGVLEEILKHLKPTRRPSP